MFLQLGVEAQICSRESSKPSSPSKEDPNSSSQVKLAIKFLVFEGKQDMKL